MLFAANEHILVHASLRITKRERYSLANKSNPKERHIILIESCHAITPRKFTSSILISSALWVNTDQIDAWTVRRNDLYYYNIPAERFYSAFCVNVFIYSNNNRHTFIQRFYAIATTKHLCNMIPSLCVGNNEP